MEGSKLYLAMYSAMASAKLCLAGMKELPPVAILGLGEDDAVLPMFFNDAQAKATSIHALKMTAKAMQAEVVVLVTDAWMAVRQVGDELPDSVSDLPDRVSAIVVHGLTRDGEVRLMTQVYDEETFAFGEYQEHCGRRDGDHGLLDGFFDEGTLQ